MKALKYFLGNLFVIFIFLFIPYKEYLISTNTVSFIGNTWFSIAYLLTWVYIIFYIFICLGLISIAKDNNSFEKFSDGIMLKHKGAPPHNKWHTLPYIIALFVGIQYNISYVYIVACMLAFLSQWFVLDFWKKAYTEYLKKEAKKGSVYEEKHLS